MNFAENSDTPLGMSEEYIEDRIVGVVNIEYFNMKKVIDIFGDRSDTAVMK